MYRRIFPLFGLIAALAASSFGQNSYQFTASLAGDPALDRPRLVTESPATVNASVVAKMLEFCARHNIEAVTENYKMSQINEAFERLESGKARYRIVLENDF